MFFWNEKWYDKYYEITDQIFSRTQWWPVRTLHWLYETTKKLRTMLIWWIFNHNITRPVFAVKHVRFKYWPSRFKTHDKIVFQNVTYESLDDIYCSKFSTGCNPHVPGWRPQPCVSFLQLDVGCPVVIAAAIPDAMLLPTDDLFAQEVPKPAYDGLTCPKYALWDSNPGLWLAWRANNQWSLSKWDFHFLAIRGAMQFYTVN